MTTAQVNRRLVGSIVKNHFGESVSAVADCLLLRGECHLGLMVQGTALSVRVIKEALFILIHHSLVTFSSEATPATYYLDVEAVILRIGYGKVVAEVAEKFSPAAADLLLDVMVAGRINMNSTPLSAGPDYRSNLDLLLKDGILEICLHHPKASSTAIEHDDEESTNSFKRKAPTVPSLESVKRTKSMEGSSSDVYVKFNARPTIHRFVIGEFLIRLVTDRLNSTAGKVIEAILSFADFSTIHSASNTNTNAAKSKSASASSFPSPATTIYFNLFELNSRLPKNLTFPLEISPKTTGITGSPLQQYLHLISSHFPNLLQACQTSMGANTFSLNLAEVRRALRHCLMESFVRCSFGVASLRILRLLREKRMLEERQISKLAMLPGKEVRERLFVLLQLGLVTLQEVPKTSDHAPSRTIFLWSIAERANYMNPAASSLYRSFAARLAFSVINVLSTAHLEQQKHAQLLEKVQRTDVIASNFNLLSVGEQEQLAKLKRDLLLLNLKASQLFSEFIIFKE